MSRTHLIRTVAALFFFSLACVASAQDRPAQPPRGRGRQGPNVVSPEVQPDRSVIFRILAPKATAVSLNAGDIQVRGPHPLTKGENGVWELKLGPIDPGAYRYTFNVDGVTVVDPRTPATSESNANVWSVVYVPGSPISDEAKVPHGTVAAVYYDSTALGRNRRMHVYTPPGYEAGSEKYPVFYLLHGASDSDDSWTSVGRANFILDNLIAAGKAKPMIVVMPAGHTTNPLTPRGTTASPNEFDDDFVKDIRPYVESHYRVLTDRNSRAIAGLSMGGGQTLSISLAHLQDYGYIGVFSSGLFQRNLPEWETQHKDILDDAAAKQGLKLFWFSTGADDFLLPRTKETVALLQKHGFKVEFTQSTGGHIWINWRNYLSEFAPQLFR